MDIACDYKYRLNYVIVINNTVINNILTNLTFICNDKHISNLFVDIIENINKIDDQIRDSYSSSCLLYHTDNTINYSQFNAVIILKIKITCNCKHCLIVQRTVRDIEIINKKIIIYIGSISLDINFIYLHLTTATYLILDTELLKIINNSNLFFHLFKSKYNILIDDDIFACQYIFYWES